MKIWKLKTEFSGLLGTVVIFTVWFLVWLMIMLHATITKSPGKPYNFVQYKDASNKNLLYLDTIYINNYFEITGIKDSNDVTMPNSIFFNKNPKTLLWYFLLITLSSLSCAFLVPLINKVGVIMRDLNKPKVSTW